MSDYGFATYDEKTGEMSEKINSKYPVFGPEYNNITKQYKTLKITDTTTKSVRTASLSVPTNAECWMIGPDHYFGENSYMNYFDELVASYEHGMKKRPLGYAVITGTLRRNQRYTLVQDQVSGMDMGGDFSLSGTLTDTAVLIPKANSMASTSTTVYEMWDAQVASVKVSTTSQGDTASTAIIIPNDCDGAFVRNIAYHLNMDSNGLVSQLPFRVEITDTEVKLYRRTFWYDSIARAYQTEPAYAAYNVNQRTKIIEDYAGSNLDVTIYLVPYSLEDLE